MLTVSVFVLSVNQSEVQTCSSTPSVQRLDLISHKSTPSHDVLATVHHTALERFKMSQRLIDNCDCLSSDGLAQRLPALSAAVDARHIHGTLLALSLLFKKANRKSS